MLTGQPLYVGGTAAETLIAIIEREPDLSTLPATTPANIRALIARCLTKDPRKRLQAIGEARIAIDHAIAQSDRAPEPQQRVNGLVVRFTAERVLRWTAIITAALGVGIGWWAPWRTAVPAALIRVNAELGVDASLTGSQGDVVALSPDGSTIAFVAQTSARGPAQLYVRHLNELEATALRGTDDASSPFFSPDGQWVAFFAAGSLKKISVSGGAAVTLCRAPNGRGGAWGEDGTIVFAPDSQPGVNLQRVPSAGGEPAPLLRTFQPGTLATLAATLARGQGGPLYGRRQPRRCQRRQYRCPDLSKRPAHCRSARRLSRAVSTERSPRLHAARNAVCGPIRSRSRRSQGRSDGRRPRHQLEPGDRRGPICDLVQRHAGLSAWAQHQRRNRAVLVGSCRKDNAHDDDVDELVQSDVRARRPSARPSDQRRGSE